MIALLLDYDTIMVKTITDSETDNAKKTGILTIIRREPIDVNHASTTLNLITETWRVCSRSWSSPKIMLFERSFSFQKLKEPNE